MMNFLFTCTANQEALKSVLGVFDAVLNLIKILVPVGLVLMGSLDLGRAVIASKDDEIKKFTTILIKRVVLALVIFLLGTIVQIVMGLVPATADVMNCVKGHI